MSKFSFYNDIHGTSADVTAKNYRISQRQLERIWNELCGDPGCHCGYGGVEGPNKYRIKKLGGIFNEGGEII